MLRLVLPKGSLEKATLELFAAADLAVVRGSDVDYRATIDDPRVDEVRILRPQEIPGYVAEGNFDLGITGRDWIEETGAEVISLGELAYSKATANPIRVVLAVAQDSAGEDDRGPAVRGARSRPSTPSSPGACSRSTASTPRSGCPTAPPRPRSPTSPTPWWRSPRRAAALAAAGLRIVETLLVSRTELIANPVSASDPDQATRHGPPADVAPGCARGPGQGAAQAQRGGGQARRGRVGPPGAEVSDGVGALRRGGFAVETVVPKSEVNVLIPALKDRGATDIIELPLSKIVH